MKKFWALLIGLFFVSYSNAAVDIGGCTGSYSAGNTLNISLEYPVVSECIPMNINQYSKIEFKSTWSGEHTVTGRILYKNGKMLGYATDDIYYLSPGKYFIYVESYLTSASNNDQSSISLTSTVKEVYPQPSIDGDSFYTNIPTGSYSNYKDGTVATIKFNTEYKENIGFRYEQEPEEVSWGSPKTSLSTHYRSNENDWFAVPVVDEDTKVTFSAEATNSSSELSVKLYKEDSISFQNYMTLNIPSDFQTKEATLKPNIRYFVNARGYGSYSFKLETEATLTPEPEPEPEPSTGPTKEEVAKLYVATFNRAPDSAGLLWWTNSSNLTLSQIAQSFFDQPETKALYPEGTSNRDFIESVYQNLFNRAPDLAGWDYWENELNIGSFSKNRFIEAVINGAQGSDIVILTNKTDVGIAFADAGMNNEDDAKSIMKNITSDSSTVTDAKSHITNNNIPSLNGSSGSSIVWLENEPDGYFHWQEASDWCTNQGYRLPYMSELIEAWNAGGGVPSPVGFQKDTFYWSADAGSEAGTHKGCAMDYDCSVEPTFGWEDIYGNGHPKCVISN